MNISFIDPSKTVINPTNQVLYVEELCKPFLESLSKAYIVVAIFNICYSFIWTQLNRHKDKVLIRVPIEGKSYVLTLGNIAFMLDIIFFMLNFFVFGYWLVLKNPTYFMELPVIRWFI